MMFICLFVYLLIKRQLWQELGKQEIPFGFH